MSPEPSTSTHGRSSQGLQLSKGRRLCSGAGLGSSAPCLSIAHVQTICGCQGLCFRSGPGRRPRHPRLRSRPRSRPAQVAAAASLLRPRSLSSEDDLLKVYAHVQTRTQVRTPVLRMEGQAEGWGKRLGHTEPQSPEGAGERCGGRGTQGAHRERTASTRRSQMAWNPCSAPGTFLGTGEAEGARDP